MWGELASLINPPSHFSRLGILMSSSNFLCQYYMNVQVRGFVCIVCLSSRQLVCYTHVCPCILSLCSVHWEKPEIQYRGDIEYEIYLGQRALALDEQPDEETKKNIDTDENDVSLCIVYEQSLMTLTLPASV